MRFTLVSWSFWTIASLFNLSQPPWGVYSPELPWRSEGFFYLQYQPLPIYTSGCWKAIIVKYKVNKCVFKWKKRRRWMLGWVYRFLVKLPRHFFCCFVNKSTLRKNCKLVGTTMVFWGSVGSGKSRFGLDTSNSIPCSSSEDLFIINS